MHGSRLLLLGFLLAACGDDGGGTPGDDAATCVDDCVPGWWTVATGPCDLCGLDPRPRECDQADCESLDAHELAEGGVHTAIWTSHSPSARTFTVLTILPESAWSVPEACTLEAESSCSGPFTCEGDDTIRFASCQGPYQRPSAELEAALVTALAQGPGEYSY